MSEFPPRTMQRDEHLSLVSVGLSTFLRPIKLIFHRQGRIGRIVFRNALEMGNIDVVAVNEYVIHLQRRTETCG